MPDLIGHDRSAAAFAVYLFLWSKCAATGRSQISYATIATETGLSKAGAQRAIAALRSRKLVSSRKTSPTSVPEYRVARPWLRALRG